MKHNDIMAHMGFKEPERKPLTNIKPLTGLTKASQVDMQVKPVATPAPVAPAAPAQPKKKTPKHGAKARHV